MRRSVCALFVVAASLCHACVAQIEGEEDETQGVGSALAGDAARGAVPAGLPAKLLVGLFEDSGQTWMKNSGVAWGARYRYFTKGWVNNWGFSAYDGSWGLAYLRECDQQGYVPAVQYYQLFAEPGGGESATLAKLQNASTMRSYFGDFKILMQRVKDFGKPALILLEADALGFLEQQSGGNPNAYAAIAASGMPELAGLPNTVAGFGLAFLQLRKSVGANNAVLGVHLSAWASGKDIAHFNVTEPLGPEVDKVYAFLAPGGLAANVTGQTYDVLVGDPLDRDADYYRLVQGQDRWWNASDSASINSRSFNRYAEWLRLWNAKASKRWVLWQIPLGNSSHKNVCNNGGSAEGYKDNRPEYFFGSGTAHLTKFADAGVIALLFGAGASCQSSYGNDIYSDGQSFMKSRAGAILAAGGVPIADGRGGGAAGSGGAGGSGGASGSGAGAGGSGGSAGGGGTCSAVNGSGTGLKGDYFSGRTLATLVTTRTDARVDFDWGSGSPATGVAADNFSVRWSGQVSTRFGGATTFYTRSDDGVRLWVNGQLLIDNWTDHGPTENSASLTLNAGQRYDLRMEYYENGGGAVARLSWSSACEPKQVIPPAQLYPAASSAPSDPSQYGFESTTQGWATTGGMLTAVASSTDRAFAGARSLKVTVNGAAGSQRVRVTSPITPAGANITFRVYIPSGSTLASVQPYVLQGAAGGWAWTGSWRAASSLTANQWNAITVQVPSNAAVPLAELGVELTTQATWTGAVYVDAVAW